MKKIILILVGIFLITLISAYDESIFTCGGDDELQINCLGDDELNNLQELPSRTYGFTGVSQRVEEEIKKVFIEKKNLFLLFSILITMSLFLLIFILYRRKKKK